MKSLRVVANRVLWRWGLRDVLPGYYIQRIPVTECGEPLEPIPAVPGRLLLDHRLHRPHLARRSVAGALRQAAELLPETGRGASERGGRWAPDRRGRGYYTRRCFGAELWMGTSVGEFTDATLARATVTDVVRWRRKLLTRCLAEVGFVNYPAEWWHFSMGDRLWAAYGRRPMAHFGPLTVGEPPKD